MVRRARPIVRAASGIILTKRVILDSILINDVTSASYDNPTSVNLLECTETMDETAESDGTTIADAPLYSRIVGFKLNFYVKAGAATDIRWMLHKLPDGEELITDANRLTNTGFHSSDDDSTFREFRKMQISKGFFGISSDRLQARIPIFVKRKALARVSPLREGDIIRFDIAKHADGTTATLNGFGTIYLKANA